MFTNLDGNKKQTTTIATTKKQLTNSFFRSFFFLFCLVLRLLLLLVNILLLSRSIHTSKPHIYSGSEQYCSTQSKPWSVFYVMLARNQFVTDSAQLCRCHLYLVTYFSHSLQPSLELLLFLLYYACVVGCICVHRHKIGQYTLTHPAGHTRLADGKRRLRA